MQDHNENGNIRENIGALKAQVKSLEELLLRIEEEREKSERTISDALTGELSLVNSKVEENNSDILSSLKSIEARLKAIEITISKEQEEKRTRKEKRKKIIGHILKGIIILSPIIAKSLWDEFCIGHRVGDLIRLIIK